MKTCRVAVGSVVSAAIWLAALSASHSQTHPPPVPTTVAQWAEGAQLFDGLGDFHRAVTTASPEAQAYFDQGMRFLWAFNHDEATRSFAKAAQLDPSCAMCFWGVALTVGPNYNLPMMAAPRAQVAWEALNQAEAQASRGTPVEQALIKALASRYPNANPLDPTTEDPILRAYADAMRSVAVKFPDDADVQVLTTESLMNIHAWKLWSLDGKLADGTEEIVARFEAILATNPNHPGANHYYIHATEASPHPEKAVPSAERLPGMMPAAGHMEHMPAHTMQRVGRYEDAAEANRKGAAADVAYYAKTPPPDYYTAYTGHNYQFLAFSAAMEGRKAEVIEAVRESRATLPDHALMMMPGMAWQVADLYTAMVRFGMWDEILAMSPPSAPIPGLDVGYRYAQATALAAKGRIDEAKASTAELERIVGGVGADVPAGLNHARDVFPIAVVVVKARIAAAEHKDQESIALLRNAVAMEDKLAYSEPADWFFPSRHLLGAALLRAGQPAEAEAVYREDLRRNPENGWALCGLAQSLKAQQRDAEAQAVQQRFEAAWKNADTPINSSAF
ncbi:MAG: hypothetical protein JO227_06985 [Acetobacteraceae bacterium]|nr:hypothetical protein [Acetobacteraceae bacterium]